MTRFPIAILTERHWLTALDTYGKLRLYLSALFLMDALFWGFKKQASRYKSLCLCVVWCGNGVSESDEYFHLPLRKKNLLSLKLTNQKHMCHGNLISKTFSYQIGKSPLTIKRGIRLKDVF